MASSAWSTTTAAYSVHDLGRDTVVADVEDYVGEGEAALYDVDALSDRLVPARAGRVREDGVADAGPSVRLPLVTGGIGSTDLGASPGDGLVELGAISAKPGHKLAGLPQVAAVPCPDRVLAQSSSVSSLELTKVHVPDSVWHASLQSSPVSAGPDATRGLDGAWPCQSRIPPRGPSARPARRQALPGVRAL